MVFRWLKIRGISLMPAVELGTLISIIIVAGGVLLFSELVEMVEDEPHVFDRMILLAFRDQLNLSDPIGPAWVESMLRDITSLGEATILTFMIVAVTGFLLVDRKRAAAVFMAASVSDGALFSAILKLSFMRPRPDVVPRLGRTREP